MDNYQNNNIKPKTWKLMLIAFLFVYPVINLIFFFLGDFLFQLHQLVRTFVMACIFIPLFGMGIPALQKKFYRWTIK